MDHNSNSYSRIFEIVLSSSDESCNTAEESLTDTSSHSFENERIKLMNFKIEVLNSQITVLRNQLKWKTISANVNHNVIIRKQEPGIETDNSYQEVKSKYEALKQTKIDAIILNMKKYGGCEVVFSDNKDSLTEETIALSSPKRLENISSASKIEDSNDRNDLVEALKKEKHERMNMEILYQNLKSKYDAVCQIKIDVTMQQVTVNGKCKLIQEDTYDDVIQKLTRCESELEEASQKSLANQNELVVLKSRVSELENELTKYRGPTVVPRSPTSLTPLLLVDATFGGEIKSSDGIPLVINEKADELFKVVDKNSNKPACEYGKIMEELKMGLYRMRHRKLMQELMMGHYRLRPVKKELN